MRRLLVLVALALVLLACEGRKTHVQCNDGTVQERNNKGSVVCIDHGGEKWNGKW